MKNFNELDRDRCMHCGKWYPLCSLVTLDEDIKNYGHFAICPKCYKKYSHDYWIEWSKSKLKKTE
jgi:hypothetical protein